VVEVWSPDALTSTLSTTGAAGCGVWWVPLASALAAAGAVVAAVFVAQPWQTHREKKLLVAQLQWEAIPGLQDAASSLRAALQAYGTWQLNRLASGLQLDDTKVTVEFDAADRAFALCVERVRDETVRSTAKRWRADAQRYYLGDETVTQAAEAKRWNKFLAETGRALRQPF